MGRPLGGSIAAYLETTCGAAVRGEPREGDSAENMETPPFWGLRRSCDAAGRSEFGMRTAQPTAPLPSSTETVELKFATARSGLASPFKSPTATERGKL